jgi:hypothetical protein
MIEDAILQAIIHLIRVVMLSAAKHLWCLTIAETLRSGGRLRSG